MRLGALAACAALLLAARSAVGQTWADSRTTPILNEIVAIDATGEPGWLYGAEDLAGDGEQFQQQEHEAGNWTGNTLSKDPKFGR